MPLASPLRTTLARTALVLASAAAVATFAGCGDSDGDSGSSGGASQITATTGADIFKAANCSSCHTLAAEGATGVIGPNLDEEKPSSSVVNDKVTNGEGTMPAFKKRLSAEQIQTVSDYVAEVAGQ